jgi:transcriptional regulator with XRE-family HTH domain
MRVELPKYVEPRMADALIRIGLGVREYRRTHGLTQQQLERLCGVDQTTISRLENGLAPGIRLERLARIGSALPQSSLLGMASPALKRRDPWG